MKQKFKKKTHIQMGTEPILMAAFHNGWGRGAIPQTGQRGDGGEEELDLHPPSPAPRLTSRWISRGSKILT